MNELIEQNIRAIDAQIAQLQGARQVWQALKDAGATVTLPEAAPAAAPAAQPDPAPKEDAPAAG
jgi:hypothetical protein